MQNKYLEQEWRQMRKEEQRFLNENRIPRKPGWQQRVEKYVPDKLEGTLNTVFCKAFEVIFEKGTGAIEKTCGKEKKQHSYQVHEYAARIRGNRKSLQAFGREANTGKLINTAVSAVEGVGMGVLGMGIPDIPVFLAVLLKSIYEIALSYGFSYDTEEERIFILRLIERIARQPQETADAPDACGELPVPSFKAQIRRTSDALAAELLYLKFVQGIPIIGVAGGWSDVVYQKKISDYAAVKYKRRFLEEKRRGSS